MYETWIHERHLNGSTPTNGQVSSSEVDAYNPSLMLYSIYLPLNYNDGQPIAKDKLAWAHTEIVRYAGGSTVFPVTDGWWIDEQQQVFRDRVTPIWVVAAGDLE